MARLPSMGMPAMLGSPLPGNAKGTEAEQLLFLVQLAQGQGRDEKGRYSSFGRRGRFCGC